MRKLFPVSSSLASALGYSGHLLEGSSNKLTGGERQVLGIRPFVKSLRRILKVVISAEPRPGETTTGRRVFGRTDLNWLLGAAHTDGQVVNFTSPSELINSMEVHGETVTPFEAPMSDETAWTYGPDNSLVERLPKWEIVPMADLLTIDDLPDILRFLPGMAEAIAPWSTRTKQLSAAAEMAIGFYFQENCVQQSGNVVEVCKAVAKLAG